MGLIVLLCKTMEPLTGTAQACRCVYRTKGVKNIMKIKRMLSVLLAAVMAFSLLCAPAFAAGKDDTLKEINNDNSIWVGVTNLASLAKKHTFNVRFWYPDVESSTWTKQDPVPRATTVFELPLGVTLAAGPNNNFLGNIWAYTDSDGDGIYDERMEKIVWTEDGELVSVQLLPVSAGGPFVETDTEWYFNAFDWGYGPNFLEAYLKGTPGYHTLTTDYLVERFGANTLMLFWDEDEENCFAILLTGKAAPAGLICSPESQGVYFSGIGDVVSGWAVEPVNASVDKNVYSETVGEAHNYNLTENITRAEFADIIMNLYFEMSGKDTVSWSGGSAFVDVSSNDTYYKPIMAAYTLGIVKGTTTTTFSPNSLVKRQDAAVMLARVYEVLGGKIPAVSSTSFADNGQIKDYAKSAVAFMTSKGILNGVGGNRFNPNGPATVEQTLKIAMEMLNKLG